MEANYYGIYTSLNRIYNKTLFLVAKFPKTETMVLCEQDNEKFDITNNILQ